MDDFEQEEWSSLYAAAMGELEHSLTAGRIGAARQSIITRLEILYRMPRLRDRERLAIADATRMLNLLEKDEERYDAEERRRVLEKALDELRRIQPTIEKLDPADGS